MFTFQMFHLANLDQVSEYNLVQVSEYNILSKAIR